MPCACASVDQLAAVARGIRRVVGEPLGEQRVELGSVSPPDLPR